MLIKGIDVPDDLLRAQAAGELVIFAGAGVSNPPPSSLPLFNGLAAQIGSGTGIQKESDDPEDRYLGRLKKNGVRVHEAAAQILVDENTKPHDLHRLLLQLFPTTDKVRVVTTNFDTHFSTTSKDLFGGNIETFYAPALPLGDDFAGLVYLHGCAGKDPIRCVLTDEDFGRAYLTQAWASRFLASMFARYVVLFVGYSHNDTVMNYLARGLPPISQKPRYAFTTDDNASLSKWEFLGIRPLIYKKCEGANPHQAITDSSAEWVKELQRGLLEKAERIRVIVTGQPPLEGEDADYIKFSLAEVDTARLFFKHAKSPDWISWLEKRDFLKPVFDGRNELNQFQRQVGFWLVENFLVEHSHTLLAAIERHGKELPPHFCWFVWRRLTRQNKDATVGKIFRQWVAVLLAQPFTVLQPRDWALLLAACRLPDDKAISILLFERVTKPRVILKKAWHFSEEQLGEQDKIDFDLNLLHHGIEGEHWISKAWNDLIKPNLVTIACDLEPIVVSNLTAAHTLMCLSRPPKRNRDPFHHHRQSIHPHAQNDFRQAIDVLIDAARDILSYLVEAKPQQAAARIEAWFESNVPTLRRVAIFGFAKRNDRSPDEKLRWILENELLYEFKPDVFWFLQQSYPHASLQARQEIINRALLGPKYEGVEESDSESIKYVIFNLFVWLHRIAPECSVTTEQLNSLKRENPKFGERDVPDLDFWSSSATWVDPTDGIGADGLLQRNSTDVLDELLACKPKTPFERGRENYCSAVSAAIAKSPEWGVAWVKTLVDRNLTDQDLWYSACQGWRNANFTAEQWKLVLDVAEIIAAPVEFFSAFAEVLEHGSRRETHTLPDEFMEQAQKIAIRIWNLALKTSPVEEDSYKDWLTTAINRPGGKLAEFWLQRISSTRKAAGDAWRSFPTSISNEISEMLRGTSGAAAHARILFASQLHYFFSLDASFARNELLPLFNWQSDELRAEQCWHGFLFWGRWLPGFTESLLPQFTETVIRKAQLEKRTREHLIYHIAGIALFRLENPLLNNWLPNQVQKLDDDERIQLAAAIDRSLGEIDVSIAEKIWERWLAEYWKMRALNTPKPLLPKEATEMVCWALSVGRYFPDAVRLIPSLGREIDFEHAGLFWRIDKKKGLARMYPEATADLILFCLEFPLEYFFADEHTANVWRDLSQSGVTPEKLRKIREAMFRHGHDPGQP